MRAHFQAFSQKETTFVTIFFIRWHGPFKRGSTLAESNLVLEVQIICFKSDSHMKSDKNEIGATL